MSKELAEVIVDNGIMYRLGEHDLYYPDLGLPEGTHYNIGKYGLMRWEYLKVNRRGEYLRLLLDGKLNEHLHDPHEFKVFGTVRHHDGTKSKQWKPMGKSISNLYRYAEVSKACNQRFLDSLVDIVPVNSTLEELGTVCSGKTVKGKKVSGFNVWSPDVMRIMETVSDGKYLISGFRNRDIAKAIFPAMRDPKKLSSKTSRTLKKLRQHGLIKKVPHSRRYHVTSKGRRIMGTLIELRRKDYPKLAAKAA